MKLYLLRHAEAMSPQQDINRPLTAYGKAQVLKLAKFLQPQAILIDTIYHSGVLRAAQTAELFASVIDPDVLLARMPILNDPFAITDIITTIDAITADTLLVGHIPVLPTLVSALVVKNENAAIVDFQLATLVCLEKISVDRWSIEWMIRPELLS